MDFNKKINVNENRIPEPITKCSMGQNFIMENIPFPWDL